MFSFLRRHTKSQQSSVRKSKASLSYESLESRNMMATFTVINLNDAGTGSLRQAMLDANGTAGADVINFSVAGTISLSSALPKLTDKVNIDGTSAPGYSASPVVQVDFNNKQGLRLEVGASGSEIHALSLVDAKSTGLKLNDADNVLIAGNYIGLGLDGTTIVANRGAGIDQVNSTDTVIGGTVSRDKNVISGNRGNGVQLSGSSDNIFLWNHIGTDAAGAADRGNRKAGIHLKSGSSNNLIGSGAGNVISGNDGDGIHITGGSSGNVIHNNRIGVNAAGNAVLGNGKTGIKIQDSDNNLIGQETGVSNISWYDGADGTDILQPIGGWQGIRGADSAGEYMITGTQRAGGGATNALLYVGTIDGDSGTSYTVNYPTGQDWSIYGPDNLAGNNFRVVGTYQNPSNPNVSVNGYMFEGTTADTSNPANYRTINYPGAVYTYLHSTAGGLVVGNYDNPADHGTAGLPYGPGHAFIYDIATDTFLTDIVFPGSACNTVYGIWHNGGTSYTLCGGFGLDPANNFDNPERPIGTAYLVDYDSATGLFTNWKSFTYPNGYNFVTHFEGLSSTEDGVYTISADSAQAGTGDPLQGSWVVLRRNADGSFGRAEWVDLDYPVGGPGNSVTSSDSVYRNQVVGIVVSSGGELTFQGTVNIGFELSNVISGNGGDGIALHNADNNIVAMNYIGTDVTGTLDLGNAKSGIVITNGAADNLIGGEETGGNNPTNGDFVVPPQGNLISGNNAYGVHLKAGATGNQLSGNFIGTTKTGNAALGNSLDGVMIDKANGNSLIGCNADQDPFVFYNVISANGGNGVRVRNSNDTTIQANFLGMGANNNTALGNAKNGLVVEGTSTRTVVGGPIPLGNVIAANAENGIVVQGKASEFTSYNTFCGLAAFSTVQSFGNGKDGMLVTSTGRDILLRTNVITMNGDDGIEISGKAKGVVVSGNIVGLDTDGVAAMGNLDNGIEVAGSASDILLGGPQLTPNVIPRLIVSSNGNNGISISGKANNVEINHAYIGLDVFGTGANLGNANNGVFIGASATGNRIGSTDPLLDTVISGNDGDGIELNSTNSNVIIGTKMGVAADASTPRPNGGNGVYITAVSSDNIIGSADGAPANIIAYNIANAIFVDSGERNAFIRNSIYGNTLPGIQLEPGTNLDQAAPVLTSVQIVGSNLQITGTFSGKARTNYVIEFFANTTNAASGRYYLGSLELLTDAGGDAAFTFEGPLAPSGANFMTATSTDVLRNNTSEFSNSVS